MPLQSDAILSYGKPGDGLPDDVRRNARRRELRILFWSMLVVVLLLALGFELRWQQIRREYFRRYDRDALVGMTPAEVTARLGRPFTSTGGTWLYQRGMDGDAMIYWRDGVVVEVELLSAAKYGGKP